jgi:hypothetical protein
MILERVRCTLELQELYIVNCIIYYVHLTSSLLA